MISPSKLHGLTFEGGILAKPVGAPEAWDAAALISVPHPDRFSIEVSLLAGNYIIGIAPSNAELEGVDIESRCGIFFNPKGGEFMDPPKLGTPTKREFSNHDGIPEVVHMYFIDGRIYLSDKSTPRVKMAEAIPAGDYR